MLETFPLVGAIILIINILSSIVGFRDRRFFENYSFEIDKIRKGEYYRLLTSGFLHVNTTHLIFNMITLYFFVSFVTYSLGGISFLILYFASLIIGNLLTLMIHYNQPNYSGVGASGAVTGVLFSSLLLFPSIELMIFFIPPTLKGPPCLILSWLTFMWYRSIMIAAIKILPHLHGRTIASEY